MPQFEASGRPFRLLDALSATRGRAVCAVAVFLLLVCFLRLGGNPLVSMEGMVVDGGARMLQTSEWAVPHVYGEMYTYKPALAYWVSAAVQAWTPDGEWWLRFPFALSGVVLGLAIYWLVSTRISPRVGLLSVFATTGTALFAEKIRIAEFDGLLTCFVGIAVLLAIMALTARSSHPLLWAVAYLSLALGFVTKGMPALMVFGPGLLVSALLLRELRRLFGWQHLLGVAVFVLGAGGYLAWAIQEGGSAVLAHSSEEAGWRAAGWSLSDFFRTLTKPPIILAAFLPWSLVVLRVKKLLPTLDDDRRRIAIAALGFLVGGILAFCVVPTHKMRYYLPLATSAGIAFGVLLDAMLSDSGRSQGSWHARTWRTVRALSTIVLIGASGILVFDGDLAWIVFPLMLLTLVWALPRRPLLDLGAQFLCCSLAVTLTAISVMAPRKAERRDLRSVAARFAEQIPIGDTVWAPAPADKVGKHAALFYYLGRPVATFAEERLPPPGAAVIYVESERERLPSSLVLAPVDVYDESFYRFHLARRVEPE